MAAVTSSLTNSLDTLKQILSTVKDIETVIDRVGSKAGALPFGGAAPSPAGSQSGSMPTPRFTGAGGFTPAGVSPSGMPIPRFTAAKQQRMISGAAMDGAVYGATAASSMMSQTFNSSRPATPPAPAPSFGQRASRVAADVGVGILANGFGHLASQTQATYSTDLLYNRLSLNTGMSQGGMPRAAFNAYAGTMTGGMSDVNSALAAGYNNGYTGSAMLSPQFSKGLGSLAVNTGQSLSQAMQMSIDQTQIGPTAKLRQYGIHTMDAAGNPVNPMTVISQLAQVARVPMNSKAAVDTAFSSTGGFHQDLAGMLGYSNSQIASLKGAFEVSQKTGVPIDSPKFNAVAKANGLDSTAIARALGRSTATANTQSRGFNAQVSGLDAANASARTLSTSFNHINDALGHLLTTLANFSGSFAGGIATHPGGATSTIGSIVKEGIGAKLLKDVLLRGKGAEGAAGAAGGAVASAGGLVGRAAPVLLKGLKAASPYGIAAAGGMAAKAIFDHMPVHGTAKKVGDIAASAGTDAAIGAGIGAAIPGLDLTGVPEIAGGVFGAAYGIGKGIIGDSSTLDSGQEAPGVRLAGAGTATEIIKLAGKGIGGKFEVTSAYRPTSRDKYHRNGDAVDFVGAHGKTDPGSLLAIDQYFARNFKNQISELIYAGPGGTNIKDGAEVSGSSFGSALNKHLNHVHVAMKADVLQGAAKTKGGAPKGAAGSVAGLGGGSGAAAKAVSFALAQVGKPYKWGATGPDSFDCSGLIQAAYASAGVSIPRTTYDQVNIGTPVAQNALIPGDLVFPDAGHVQIYVGGGKIVEAPHTGTDVRIASMWGFWKAVRVVKPAAQGTGKGGSMPMGNRVSWAKALLTDIGAPQTIHNLRAITAWEQAEGGGFGNIAAFNPLNTTQQEPGSSPISAVGVQAYTSAAQGLEATAQTLTNGHYGNILAALSAGNSGAAVLNALTNSPWGTGALASQVLAGWKPDTVPGYSVGAWNLTRDHTAKVHAGEMILPAGLAQEIRDAVAKNGGTPAAATSATGAKTVTVQVFPTQATHEEAVKLARMVKDLLESDKRLSELSKR